MKEIVNRVPKATIHLNVKSLKEESRSTAYRTAFELIQVLFSQKLWIRKCMIVARLVPVFEF